MVSCFKRALVAGSQTIPGTSGADQYFAPARLADLDHVRFNAVLAQLGHSSAILIGSNTTVGATQFWPRVKVLPISAWRLRNFQPDT